MPPKSEDRVVLRVDDLRLKEKVTIHVEALTLVFSSVKVKRQPVTISDEAKQRLKPRAPRCSHPISKLGFIVQAGALKFQG